MTFFNAHSSTINSTSVAGEGRMAVNGLTVAAARSGGVSSYVYDTPNAEEVAVVVGGGLGESDIGGPVMNIVPRSGGNTFAGHRVPQPRRRLVARRQPAPTSSRR